MEGVDERVGGIQPRAAVDPGMQVTRAGAQRQVKVDKATGGDIEGRQAAGDHAAIEDDGRLRRTVIGGKKVEDRVPASLLLAVADEAHVDGELARGGQLASRGEQQIQLPLVVGNAAGVHMLTADLRLERRRLPQVERVRRLNIEVPVAENGRGAVCVAGGAQLADGERLPMPVDQLGRSSRRAQEIAHPLTGHAHVAGMRGIRAHRGDAQQLGQLVEPIGHVRDPSSHRRTARPDGNRRGRFPTGGGSKVWSCSRRGRTTSARQTTAWRRPLEGPSTQRGVL
jgi:hypothetical protein